MAEHPRPFSSDSVLFKLCMFLARGTLRSARSFLNQGREEEKWQPDLIEPKFSHGSSRHSFSCLVTKQYVIDAIHSAQVLGQIEIVLVDQISKQS